MEKDKPQLTVVGQDYKADFEDEFVALPHYPWDERPGHLPLDPDECATAIHLSHGELYDAAALLKVPIHRLTRLIRAFPRLQRVLDESLQHALIRAASIPIRTLFDPTSDARRLEWASTKVLSSRLGRDHPLAPADHNVSASTPAAVAREIIFQWKSPSKSDTDDSP